MSFFLQGLILQNQIPEKFDLYIKIYTKQRGKWIFNEDFSISNNENIWMDLDSIMHKSSIRDIELKY